MKPRPENAPGPNGLRGGIKTYSLKTINGNWLEDNGGPTSFKRGFTTTDFQTEAQHAQLGIILKPAPIFGAELIINKPSVASTDDLWKTTTQLMSSNKIATKAIKVTVIC